MVRNHLPDFVSNLKRRNGNTMKFRTLIEKFDPSFLDKRNI